jgi:hypothetical protein
MELMILNVVIFFALTDIMVSSKLTLCLDQVVDRSLVARVDIFPSAGV